MSDAQADGEQTPTNPHQPQEGKEKRESKGQVFFDAENSEHDGEEQLPFLPASPDPAYAQIQETHQDNSQRATHRSNANDPSSALQATLRLQIADLTSQVTSFNTKLVNAYARMGDLEDELNRSESRNVLLKRRVADLEQERRQWQERVEGGLLVEKVRFFHCNT